MTKILFVEDDKDFAAPHKTLIEVAGHSVEIVGDGESALRRVRKDPFSLIIIDINLPGMNGHQLCQELRKLNDCPPILILSGLEDERNVLQSLGCADEYVRKSSSSSELLLRIKNLLSRVDDVEKRPVIYVFDNFEVDLDRLQVRKNGKPIDLTKSEFKILLAFVETPEKCWSRSELMDRVEKGFVQERVVDQHIFNLRKHFKEEKQYITTVQGSGYRFTAKVTTKAL